jgi:hypothetical protein
VRVRARVCARTCARARALPSAEADARLRPTRRAGQTLRLASPSRALTHRIPPGSLRTRSRTRESSAKRARAPRPATRLATRLVSI